MQDIIIIVLPPPFLGFPYPWSSFLFFRIFLSIFSTVLCWHYCNKSVFSFIPIIIFCYILCYSFIESCDFKLSLNASLNFCFLLLCFQKFFDILFPLFVNSYLKICIHSLKFIFCSTNLFIRNFPIDNRALNMLVRAECVRCPWLLA